MMPEAPPSFGRYAIEAEVGRGTMGVVYRARDTVLQRTVALKTIGAFPGAAADAEAFEQRFLNEARVAAALSHPNIVAVHDFGRDPATGTLFIALEYLEGETLEQLARRGPVEWPRACRIVAAVARALSAAHARGFVHRDVKPANIMALPSGEPKVMDFGIARVPASELTRAGEVFGTPSNMSPEQAMGEAIDGRSDLFSLGTVLYQLLTGRRAFAGPSLATIIHAVMNEMPAAPSAAGPAPEALDRIVSRALAKAPADRYQTGEEMAEDLEDAAEGRAPRHTVAAGEATRILHKAAVPPAAGQATVAILRAPAAPGPRPRRWIAIAIAALLAVVAAIGLFRRPRPAPSTSPRTETRAAPPAAPAAEEETGPAHLVIDFDHHLRGGSLKVWVDDDLVLERALEGRLVQKLGRVRLYKGRLRDTLEVSSAKHAVKVEVAWDGKVRTARTAATFRAGAERTLDVQVLRVLDELVLEWK